MEALKWMGSLLLWGVLLFSQHLVCFDMFDTNYGYLHLLALVLWAVQGALLYGNRKRRSLLLSCGLAYSAVSVLKIPLTFALFFTGGWQTHLTCLLLDMAGAVWCFLLAGRCAPADSSCKR